MKNNNQLFLGIILVLIGAASYGVLATMVGLSYKEGFSTTEVVFSQYLIGLLILGIMSLNLKKTDPPKKIVQSKEQNIRLIIGGMSLGFIGFFYYWAVQYIPVSIAVVLLMQSIWISIVLEAIIDKKIPNTLQIAAVLVVIIGTLFATDAIHNLEQLNGKGLLFGSLAGFMYALMLLVMNRWGHEIRPAKKSFLMLIGATIIVLGIGSFNMPTTFDFSIFWKWGIWLALFGTILPPILLNKGMPKTGIALGAVLIAVEIPISVLSAHLFLKEKVNIYQWIGIFLIVLAVILINYKSLFINKKNLR